jgi:hypothetical protein
METTNFLSTNTDEVNPTKEFSVLFTVPSLIDMCVLVSKT